MAKTAVIGAGSWGTALAILLSDNGHEVTVWSHRKEEAERIQSTRRHESKLPGVEIPDGIVFTDQLAEAVNGKDLLVLAVPSSAIRSTSRRLKDYVTEGQIIVNVAKGIEEGTLFTMTDIIEEELPGVRAAALSGPSHAEEVSRRMPTTCVVGAHSRELAEYIQSIFISPAFRVYTSPDLLGIELGAALKNVIALAAGTADGLGYGDNTKAALITRGITEITRLGIAMGGRQETFYGLAGIGDLIVTCASVHSRNRKAGYLIGQGRTMQEAMDEVKMVVEGVYSAKAAIALSRKYQVEMPIVEQINQVLFEGKKPDAAVRELMMRNPREELEW
ncbi:MAG: NAD(P)H-dependent glycerol-3-phosphate dehydrogenase [Eubacteriales bacterium]|nr:NAD(P)H-dependent glycerol-3-phosphate dehydrogenase [Eubacteriales bacterium]